MDSEVSGMKTANKDIAITENKRTRKRYIHLIIWSVLAILFTIFAAHNLYINIYCHFDLSFLYSIPYLIPAIICWIMSILLIMRNLIGNDIYHSAIVALISVIGISFVLMLISLGRVVYLHEDSTTELNDYHRARTIANAEKFPKHITDDMKDVSFKYYAEDSSAYMSLTFHMSDEDFEKERAAIESKSILIDDELHNKISHTIQSDFDISELAPTISCDHFYSDVQIYYLDHDFKQTYTTVRTGENNKLTPIPSGYKGENFYCAMLCDKENIIVYYYHHLIVSV